MVEEDKSDQPQGSTPREIFDDLKEWSGKVFQKVREEADTLSTKGKLKIDLTTLRSKRNTEFRALGEKVFHLLSEGTYDIPEAAGSLDVISGLTEKIGEVERQYEAAGRKPGGEIEAPDVDPDREETGV